LTSRDSSFCTAHGSFEQVANEALSTLRAEQDAVIIDPGS
jgi:hypothetical protein